MKKKVFIIGNSTKDYTFAKWMSKANDVYITTANNIFSEFATCVDIRENSINEILEYVMETGIDLTIATSDIAIQENIVKVFENANQAIFAPTCEASKLIYDKALMKKVLYKLKIPTPKFGIFEKSAIAFDYIKNLQKPFVIKTNDIHSAVILTDTNVAKNLLDCCLAEKVQKIIVEDYVYGTPFSFYVITDGYKILPLGSSIIYRFALDGDGGQLTTGMGACSPNHKISFKQEEYLVNKVAYSIIDYIKQEGSIYSGILCLQGIITEDNSLQIIGLQPFMSDCDCITILNVLGEDFNLYDLLLSCSLSTFSDEYDYIPQAQIVSTSLVTYCMNKNNSQNIIQGLDNLDENTDIIFYPSVTKNKYLEYEANNGAVMLLSTKAATQTSSVRKIYSEVENINYSGIKYRHDIGKTQTTNFC